jgi:hypothetical protein
MDKYVYVDLSFEPVLDHRIHPLDPYNTVPSEICKIMCSYARSVYCKKKQNVPILELEKISDMPPAMPSPCAIQPHTLNR